MTNFDGWIADEDVGNKYLEKCKLFSDDEKSFNNFRRDIDYTKVLEGGQRVVGDIHLERIMKRGNIRFLLDNIKAFKENDKYGNPVVMDFGMVSNINPCTLLYISHLCDVRVIMKDFKPKKILEIGGGFGGFCKILSSIYSFNEYIMIDLPAPIALAKKYLSNFPELYNKITFITTAELKYIKPIEGVDLFIATSSLSECDEETQHYYVDNFLLKAKFGYIIYNTAERFPDTYIFILAKLIEHFNILAEKFYDIEVLLLENKINGD